MNVLLCWVPYLFDKQFVSLVGKYRELTQLRASKFVEGLVWTNVSYYDSYDYKLLFDKYDKFIYIYRNPLDMINAFYIILNYKSLLRKETPTEEFLKQFIKRHLTVYYTHYIAHLIKGDLWNYDSIIRDRITFKSFVECINPDFPLTKEIHPHPIKEELLPIFDDKIKDFVKLEWIKLGGYEYW